MFPNALALAKKYQYTMKDQVPTFRCTEKEIAEHNMKRNPTVSNGTYIRYFLNITIIQMANTLQDVNIPSVYN